MSETDSFLQEVTEELRRDRMMARWKRYGPYVIIAVVAIVVGAGVSSWWKQHVEEQARERGARFLAAADAGDAAARADAYAALAQSEEGAAPIARMSEAGALLEAGDTEGAVAALQAVADESAASPVYRDLARLKILQIESADLPPQEVADRAAELAGDGAPYRLPAMELRGLALIKAGDLAGAREQLTEVLQDAAASSEMQGRVQQVLRTLPQPEAG